MGRVPPEKNAVPRESGEPPVIAFFDVDNTLLRGASIFHIGRGAFRRRLITLGDIISFGWKQLRFISVGENHRHLEVVRERALELAGGHSVSDLEELANEVYDRYIEPKLWPETVALTREHLGQGHSVVLVTATPETIANIIAERLGLTGAIGTRIEVIDGLLTGHIDGPVLHGDHKADAARQYAADTGVDLATCWAYTDSRNDIPLLELVGNRVVVNPDKALSRYASAKGWRILQLHPRSIRAAKKAVRRAAKQSAKNGSGS